jgi:serine/threonine protein kinase
MTGLTEHEQLLESFDCTPPEYIEGAEIDWRVDIYGLGCVLYEALTAEVPYPRSGSPAKMYAHHSADPPSPRLRRPDVPERLDAVVTRALAKAPESRQGSASEFAIEVAGALDLSSPPWTRSGMSPPDAASTRSADQATARRDGAEDRAPVFSERHVYQSASRHPSLGATLWALGVILFVAAPAALLIALPPERLLEVRRVAGSIDR